MSSEKFVQCRYRSVHSDAVDSHGLLEGIVCGLSPLEATRRGMDGAADTRERHPKRIPLHL